MSIETENKIFDLENKIEKLGQENRKLKEQNKGYIIGAINQAAEKANLENLPKELQPIFRNGIKDEIKEMKLSFNAKGEMINGQGLFVAIDNKIYDSIESLVSSMAKKYNPKKSNNQYVIETAPIKAKKIKFVVPKDLSETAKALFTKIQLLENANYAARQAKEFKMPKGKLSPAAKAMFEKASE